jgi:hypothetical protein
MQQNDGSFAWKRAMLMAYKLINAPYFPLALPRALEYPWSLGKEMRAKR